MGVKEIEKIQRLLADPFDPEHLEWKPQNSGIYFDGNPWVNAIAYVNNRAIQARLDEVLGVMNWRNEFEKTEGGFLCGLSIRVDGEWITKWDGAEYSNIEKLKGSLSNSMKRSAVHFGIGRYLYGLGNGRAKVITKGEACPAVKKDGIYARIYRDNKNKRKDQSVECYWFPPALPDWAHPGADFEPYLDAISRAETLDDLKTAWEVAYRASQSLQRVDLKDKAEKIKNRKKAELSAIEIENATAESKKFHAWLNTNINDRITTAENESVLSMNYKHLLQELKGHCRANKVDSSDFEALVNQAHKDALNKLNHGV